MSTVVQLGEAPWSRDELRAALESFAELYARRPIDDNLGGMRSPHMFATWFALRALKPKAVIESGLWYGQSTWLIEQACPEAQLYCIDIDLDRLRYRSERARYFDRDFATLDWSELPLADTVGFFDDHQNAVERVRAARRIGLRHLLFEDNYPAACGDCYSLKKAFMHAGFAPEAPAGGLGDKLKRLVGGAPVGHVPPNERDDGELREALAIYFEFPPPFKPPTTRWGDRWEAPRYPTPEPLLERVERPYQQVYLDEAQDYTWLCYARVRG
jgi:hypothetical protein